MIKAIFFDWGHTFTGSGFFDVKEPINKLLKPYGLKWDTFYPYWRSLYQLRSSHWIKTDEEFYDWLAKLLCRDDIPFPKIQEVIIDSHRIPEGNIEVVKELKKDYKVGLLTNNVQEWVDRVLKNYKIEELFDAVIVSSKVGVRKPDARIFQAALKSLTVKPREAIFVSDELAEDLIGSKGLGIISIWLRDPNVKSEWKQRELAEEKIFEPDATISGLEELPPLLEKINQDLKGAA